MLDADPLARYWAKRDFSVTSEPRGQRGKTSKSLSFVIQKHAASRLHYDFRLELDGVLVSWAVPKGPSYDPSDKRMAIHVEDHPLSYASFEGTIPAKQYGAGTVIAGTTGRGSPSVTRMKVLRRASWSFACMARRWRGCGSWSGSPRAARGVKSSKDGSSALDVTTALVSIGVQRSNPQQVEACTTVHLALEELESVDLPFELSAAPDRFKRRAYR
jgi:DNA ligase D-like protein (predicted 3'-phosphoesterase)